MFLPLAIALFEAVAWGVDLRPYTAHSEMDPGTRAMLVGINAVPHLLLGFMGFRRQWRVAMAIYVPYVTLFTAMQTVFWWLPYFFGLITPERLAEQTAKLAGDGVLRLLPDAGPGVLVPSAEHTLLFPLSVLAALGAARAFVRSPAVGKGSAALQLAVALAIVYGITSAADGGGEPGMPYAMAAMLTANVVVALLVVVVSGGGSSSGAGKAKAA